VPRDRLHVIPIGSAIPALDTPGGMAAVSPPVLAMFGQPAMMHPDATATLARWLQAERPPARLWWFSRSEGELRLWWSRHVGGPSEQVTFYGGLPAAEISPRLRAATLGLALYLDGASTRRSSLAALLEHGLPILGLDERYTDDRIRQSEAFALLTANRCRDLPSAAASLLSDPVRRAAMAGAARRFFSCELAWPVIAQAYVELSGRPA
jgi:glycosyltransferase involved in cell wall biosynthesis